MGGEFLQNGIYSGEVWCCGGGGEGVVSMLFVLKKCEHHELLT